MKKLFRWRARAALPWTFVLCLSLGFAAEEPKTDPEPEEEKLPAKLEHRIFSEALTDSRSFSRVMLSSRTNRFSFIVPAGFQMGKSEDGRKIVLMHPEHSGHLEVIIHEGGQPAGAQSSTPSEPGLQVSEKIVAHFQKIVTQRFPGGKIVDQFMASTGELAGPAFQIDWTNDLQQRMITRLAFVPFNGGVLEFAQQAGTANVEKLDTPFNSLLLTFRAGSGTETPEMVRLENKR